MKSVRNNSAVFAFLLAVLAAPALCLNITCVSMAVSADAEANLQTIKTQLGQAPGELVLFPELALCSVNSGKSQAWVDNAMAEIGTLCASLKKAVVVGAVRETLGLKYNSAYYITSTGVRAGAYDQIHPMASPYSPGMKIPFFPLPTSEGLIKFGVQIGNDLYFPEPWQFFAERGVRCMLLVYLSALTGTETWEKEAHDDLLMGMAADNTTFAAGASQANPNSLVKSQVVDGVGNVLGSHDPSTAGAATVQISFANPGFNFFKRHDEWRTDLYELVIKNPTTRVESRPETGMGEKIRIYPNPIAGKFSVNYELGIVNYELKGIRLAMYDINGKRIADFTDKIRNSSFAISHSFIWDASGLPSGVYLLRATLAGKTVTKRLILQK